MDSVPHSLNLMLARLRIPVVGAPMFLVSGPDLVAAQCNAGIIGAFPALNARTTDILDTWLGRIRTMCQATAAPFAVNQILHKSNSRAAADLDVIVGHRVPVVITSLSNPAPVVARVHAYGGVVLHDVVDARQARRALDEGVDGIIALTAGAGGNTGRYNPFALIEELRRIHDGPLGLAGGISTGAGLAAACAMGADFAYLGTRFIASAEANADAAYKQGVVEARLADIVTTDRVSGVPASFLGSSLEEAGLLGEEAGTAMDFGGGGNMNAKAWRDIWAAGQSAAGIDDAPPVARIVERLEREYRSTLERMRHLSATR